MESKTRILNAVKYIGGTILTIGIITFLLGFFVSNYGILTAIGIGAVMGAVFIFLIGLFFVASEAMVEKTSYHNKVVHKTEKRAP
ncbi:hypothetical protein [Virgibacillus oceani]|uniref:Uncharacterized protein n=1 Tax=Virgibacillus oceani TaxID=1479511 RepID=A0A917GYT1_9BACI|nr:hypothetical protein [Virgibacillus oceani]GGG60916.1 hypothetical protein GCM10011398_00180 [Virgibacillus oceani]